MRIEESNFEGKLLEYHFLDFGNIYFFENIIVSEINEEVIFSYKIANIIINLAFEHYGNKNVIYISNRINSYSVKPTEWVKINNKFKNLIGVGVVNYTNFSKSIFAIEKLFIKREIKGFDTLYDALHWAEEFIQKKNQAISTTKKRN